MTSTIGWKTLALALAIVPAGSCKKDPAPGAAEVRREAADGGPESGPKAATSPSEHKDETEEHEALPSKVRLAPNVIASTGIKTERVKAMVLPSTIDLTGEIASDQDRTAQVTARVSGRILEVRVKEGDRVRAGAVLAIVESPELAKARAARTSAEARLRAARLNAQRLANLEAKSLASGQEVAAAQAEAASLEADAVAARQTLAAFGRDVLQIEGAPARLDLRSPLDGFVFSRSVIRGQTVGPEQVIVVVGNLDRAVFLAKLFEKDLMQVADGAAAEVRLNALPGQLFEGKILSIGKQLDPTARTVLARISVTDHDGLLKVGLFGTARIVVGSGAPEREPKLVLPAAAVTKIANKDVVFVKQADGDFEVHPVTLGHTAAGRVEILSGLRAGEEVVTIGVFNLKGAVLKSTFGEEE